MPDSRNDGTSFKYPGMSASKSPHQLISSEQSRRYIELPLYMNEYIARHLNIFAADASGSAQTHNFKQFYAKTL